MAPSNLNSALGFTSAERAYIRRELDEVLGTLPAARDGIQLKIRKTGPKAGQPKLSPPAQTLVGRGLMRVQLTPSPRLLFTDPGWALLREMIADPHLADPRRFAHVRRELGIDSK